jgi:3-methyladenine DNA glycosylase AlkD
MKDLLKEIEKEICKLGEKTDKDKYTSDKKASNLTILDIRIPKLRALEIESFEKQDFKDKVKLVTFAFQNSNISEVLTWLLIQIDKMDKQSLFDSHKEIFRWVDFIENWWHSDAYSKINANILEYALRNDKEKEVLKYFIKWNKSDNSWARRQSIVSLLYYANSREIYMNYETLIGFVKNLLYDEKYYVQKGVGWTIREIYRLFPEKTKKFLMENAANIHPDAWQASTEKLEKSFKDRMRRKRHRK